MKLGLTSAEIGQRRIIEHIAIEQGKGEIWLNGKIERFTLDDLVDFAEMCEMLMLKHSGKMLNSKLRPQIKNRAACQFDVLCRYNTPAFKPRLEFRHSDAKMLYRWDDIAIVEVREDQ